jgi:glutaminyl-tRNA synthetase
VWEFSRLQLEYTVMSKRRLLKLVMDKHVSGWDDPRLPTLNGFRRRGYPAEALHKCQYNANTNKQFYCYETRCVLCCCCSHSRASLISLLLFLHPV